MGKKVTIIGAGSVGSTIAYTMAVNGIATEIVMIDINEAKAMGEALDIRQGVPFCPPVSIYAGSYPEAENSDIVILTSGVLPGMIREDAGINVTQAAFSQVMGGFGAPFIAVCLLFFAFSTIISWYYYGETNVRYLFRSKKAVPVDKALVVVFVFAGSLFQSGAVWALSDVCNGLMVLPNLAALVLLFPTVLAMSREDRSHPLRGYARRAEKAEKRNAAK